MVAQATGNGDPNDKKQSPKNDTPKKPDPKGIPLWAFCAGILVVLGSGILVWAVIFAGDGKTSLQREEEALQIQKAKSEIAKSRAAEEGTIAIARTRQNETLSIARSATNSLGQLLMEIAQVNAYATALKSSDEGRAIAAQPDLVSQAKRLFENDIQALPSASEVVTKLEGVRRIEQQLIAALGTTYDPDAELTATAQNAGRWAEDTLSKTRRVQALVTSLVAEGSVKSAGTPLAANAPRLDAAINQLSQGESATRTRAIVEKTTEAKAQADIILAEAEAKRIRDAAKAEADQILRAANEVAAATKRAAMVEQAKAKVEDSKAQVTALTAENEAQKVLLRQKASDPAVKA